MRIPLAWLIALLMVTQAAAHDLFLMPEKFRTADGETISIGVHSGDGFPESSELPQRLMDGLLHVGFKTTPMTDLHAAGKRSIGSLKVSGSGHVMATIITAPMTFSMKSGEFDDYLKEEGLLDVIEERAKAGDTIKDVRERYGKYAKAILLSGEPNDGYKTLTGLPIEFVPEKDPYLAKVGDSLPFRVLFRGKPVAGLEVKALTTAPGSKQQVIGKTDENGMISVKLTTAGPWRLRTILMQRSRDRSVDWESFWSTLTFEIQPSD